jgi:hypothetical protein
MQYEEFHIPDYVFWGFEYNRKRITDMLEFCWKHDPESRAGKYLADLEHVTNRLGLSYIGHYEDYSVQGEFGDVRSIIKFSIIDKHKFMLAKIMFPDLNFSLDLNKVKLEK